MQYVKVFILFIFTGALTVSDLSPAQAQNTAKDNIISYVADPKLQDIQLYFKDESATIFRSISNLKNWVESKNKTLVFAMNGGMYMQDNTPLGLFIDNEKTVRALNTSSASSGNFYLKPNGVFYITKDKKAVVCQTSEFTDNGTIRFATQSGPMLVINGEIHSVFKQGSTNLNIRNGVGILPDGKIIFAITKEEINLYDFAAWFKDQGCKNALYLDGFVSRMYLPKKNWVQIDGNFGVIIGVTAPK